MREPRWIANYKVKEENRRVHSAARSALEQYRRSGDASGFPDLRKRILGIHGLSLAGYNDDEVNPRLTQEEFNRFKAAYEASDAGKSERAMLDAFFHSLDAGDDE